MNQIVGVEIEGGEKCDIYLRRCLNCESPFFALGKYNRICIHCKRAKSDRPRGEKNNGNNELRTDTTT